MIVVCSWCGEFIRGKEPLEVEDVTHGICEKCGAQQLKSIKELEKSIKKSPQKMEG